MSLTTRIRRLLPVSRRRYVATLKEREAEYGRQLAQLNARHARELDRRSEQVKRIVARGTSLRWLQDSQRYCVVVSFDPAMLNFGCLPADDQDVLARYVAHFVEAEFRRAKFVHEPDRCAG